MGISGNWLDSYRLCGTGLNPSNHSFGIVDYRDEMQDLEARRQLHRKNSFGAAYNVIINDDTSPNPYKTYLGVDPASSKKTFKQELQSEVDYWLHDVKIEGFK